MKDSRIGGISPATLALFEGSLGAVWGLAVAVYVYFQATAFGFVVTDSFLQGLLFGLGTSALILLATPVLYFAIGWVLGYLHGLVFNAIAHALGGIMLSSGEEEPTREFDEEINAEIARPDAPSQRAGRPATTFGERIPTEEERRGDHRRRL